MNSNATLLFIVLLAGSIAGGCKMNICNQKSESEPRPLPLSMTLRSKNVQDQKLFAGMKKLDWNNIRIASKSDFVNMFEFPEELSDVQEKDISVPNKAMNGKLFSARQKIKGVPVYGSGVRVQTFAGGLIRLIEYNFSDAARKLRVPDKKLSDSRKNVILKADSELSLTEEKVFIFDPELFGGKGKVQPVWMVDVISNKTPVIRYFISMEDDKILWQIPFKSAGRRI